MAETTPPAPMPERGLDYALVAIDGAPFAAAATLQFTADGRIAGRGPCNAWNAPLLAAPPAFAAGPIAATRRACGALREEMAFFDALGRMTAVEVTDTGLVLAAADGSRMEFARQD